MRRRLLKTLMVSLSAGLLLTGCGNSKPEVGSIKGYDKGEEYLSIWVHSIEDTDEGQAYKESVNTFNKNTMVNILRTLNLFLEMIAVVVILIKSMPLLCLEDYLMC